MLCVLSTTKWQLQSYSYLRYQIHKWTRMKSISFHVCVICVLVKQCIVIWIPPTKTSILFSHCLLNSRSHATEMISHFWLCVAVVIIVIIIAWEIISFLSVELVMLCLNFWFLFWSYNGIEVNNTFEQCNTIEQRVLSCVLNVIRKSKTSQILWKTH